MTEPTYRWVAVLPARTLRALAGLAERQERPQFVDPELAAAELAEMLVAGDKPTIGWYRRQLGLDIFDDPSSAPAWSRRNPPPGTTSEPLPGRSGARPSRPLIQTTAASSALG
jgi:hypothetical protein